MKNKKRITWFIRWIYATWVREIIWDQINNTDVEWDNEAMKVLDKLFKYSNT